jgi:16S rRNA (cytidine1402-2'-O)-methyltransferase
MSTLYIVATPIGNLQDITLRALDVLKSVSCILCEDTRHSAKLLNAYGIATRMLAYHEHNGEKMRPLILEKLARGESLALISDAGTPLISDPGYKLVKEVRAAGYKVVPIPGVCAAITALCAAGMPTDQFHFCGFLPAKSSGRKEKLSALRHTEGTLVFYESPRRVTAFLTDAIAVFGGERPATLARELTKTYETFHSGTLAALLQETQQREPLKGEYVILIAPQEAASPSQEQDIPALLTHALQQYGVKDAAAMVAAATGRPKREIYQLALELNTTPQRRE